MNKEKIGKFIAELRKENDMTQDELALKLNLDRTTISKWERCLYIPTNDMILKLSELFNVSVNEIYYGERQNEDNKKQVNEIPIKILKEEKNKIKKLIIIFLTFVLILSTMFLSYYFINNYKSISVYTISGEKNNILIKGLLIMSNEQMYIEFSDSGNMDNLKKVSLYYMKDNKKIIIYEYDGKPKLYINKFGADEDIAYSDFKYLKNNLYIELQDKAKNTTEIKLKLNKSFTNNNIFSKKNNSITEKEIIESDTSIPKYIKDNFKFDEDEKFYYKNTKTKNFKLKEMYYYEVEFYVVEEIYNKYTERYEYSPFFEDLHYTKYFKEEFTTFDYDFYKNSCYTKKCDMKKVEYFKKNYLKKVD